MPDHGSGTVPYESACLFATRLRGFKTCDSYAAPSLWCDACWPRLAVARNLDTSLWPERPQAPDDGAKWSPFTDEDPY